jgi:hypothetical protein
MCWTASVSKPRTWGSDRVDRHGVAARDDQPGVNGFAGYRPLADRRWPTHHDRQVKRKSHDHRDQVGLLILKDVVRVMMGPLFRQEIGV